VALRSLSLCAGVGGLDLGVADAFARRGVHCAPACYVERDAYAAAVLVARMADEALDHAPVWADLATFDARPWCGVVDLVTAGIPCQPYSSAGKRKGHEDERALWPELVRIVRESEPSLVFVENVARFAKWTRGLYDALGELGFEWAPPLFSTAAELGAPHIRERVFLLAAHAKRSGLDSSDPNASGGRSARGAERESRGKALAAREEKSRRRGFSAPGPNKHGRESEWCGWVFDRERQTLRHNADGRDCGCRIAGSPWAGESPVCRVDDGTPDRMDRLRTLGNAVVPAQASAALAELMDWFASQRHGADAARSSKGKRY
jgi:DNA (cytosine-5)-methyltransferase 1